MKITNLATSVKNLELGGFLLKQNRSNFFLCWRLNRLFLWLPTPPLSFMLEPVPANYVRTILYVYTINSQTFAYVDQIPCEKKS